MSFWNVLMLIQLNGQFEPDYEGLILVSESRGLSDTDRLLTWIYATEPRPVLPKLAAFCSLP